MPTPAARWPRINWRRPWRRPPCSASPRPCGTWSSTLQSTELDTPFVARWALVLFFLGIVQLAYAVYLFQLPDWTTVWVVTVLLLLLAAGYAGVLGLVLMSAGGRVAGRRPRPATGRQARGGQGGAVVPVHGQPGDDPRVLRRPDERAMAAGRADAPRGRHPS